VGLYKKGFKGERKRESANVEREELTVRFRGGNEDRADVERGTEKLAAGKEKGGKPKERRQERGSGTYVRKLSSPHMRDRPGRTWKGRWLIRGGRLARKGGIVDYGGNTRERLEAAKNR